MRLKRVTLATAAIECNASPLKPRVFRLKSCSASLSLLVAFFSNAITASSSAMPEPLSITLTKSSPPFLISTVMLVAPASQLFSTSSFTTASGLSTTSPAAILPITSWGNLRMDFIIVSSPFPLTGTDS